MVKLSHDAFLAMDARAEAMEKGKKRVRVPRMRGKREEGRRKWIESRGEEGKNKSWNREGGGEKWTRAERCGKRLVEEEGRGNKEEGRGRREQEGLNREDGRGTELNLTLQWKLKSTI